MPDMWNPGGQPSTYPPAPTTPPATPNSVAAAMQAWRAQRPSRPDMDPFRAAMEAWRGGRPEDRAGMDAWREARPDRPDMDPWRAAMQAWMAQRPEHMGLGGAPHLPGQGPGGPGGMRDPRMPKPPHTQGPPVTPPVTTPPAIDPVTGLPIPTTPSGAQRSMNPNGYFGMTTPRFGFVGGGIGTNSKYPRAGKLSANKGRTAWNGGNRNPPTTPPTTPPPVTPPTGAGGNSWPPGPHVNMRGFKFPDYSQDWSMNPDIFGRTYD